MSATARLKNTVAENLVRRTPFLYRRLLKLFRASQGMSFAERKALRDKLTERTLHIASTTPYGRRLALNGGLDWGSFDQWPILEKDALRGEPAECLAKTFIPAHSASTGGTTGIPIRLKRALSSVVFEQAVLDELVRIHSSVNLRQARIAVLRGDTFKSPDDMSAPHWQLRQGGQHLVCSSFHLNASTIASFVQAIRDFRPDILWVYPSSLEAFVRLGADVMRGTGIPGLRLVLSSSEVLEQSGAAEATELLHVPVLNFYGQSERVCASVSIRAGEHFFLPAYGRVELLPAYGDDDSSLYEIIGTSYWNPAQPLVRFRTGDLVRLPREMNAEQLEAVALGILPFDSIEGRSSEYVLSPDGRRLIGMNHIPRNVPNVAQMQIVQRTPSRVEIHVVPLKDFNQQSADVILANARQKIPASIDIEIKTVEQTMRTAGGKAPLVMRLVD